MALRDSVVTFLQFAVLSWFALVLPIQQITSAARPSTSFGSEYVAAVVLIAVSALFAWWSLRTNRRLRAVAGFVVRAWVVYWLLAILVSFVTLWFTGGELFSTELSSAIRLALFVISYGIAYWYVFRHRTEPTNGSPA